MKTVQKSIHIAITLLVLLAHPTIVSANAVNKEAKLTISGVVEASWSKEQLYPSFLRGHMKLPASVQASQTDDVTAAKAFLQMHAANFGISHVDQELQMIDQVVDSLGVSHLSWQQVYQGVPVYHALIQIHLDRSADEVVAVGNGFVNGINLTTISPQIDAIAASAVGYRLLAGGKLYKQPELTIFPGEIGRASCRERV